MSQRYGQYEQVNGGVVNDALDARDTAWAELREIRDAINANAEKSTADEVRRVVAQRDKLLTALKDIIGHKTDLTNAICHYGITTPDKCGRCSRELNAHALIAEIEAAK
jgi:hypothetical protein